MIEKENPSHPDKLCDQIILHRGDQKLFWVRSNWQALCHQHYSTKTRREDQTPVYGYESKNV